jgi:HTH-type transcriptional regulator / antitoxin HigA
MKTPIKPIRTAADHRQALVAIANLWQAKVGTPEYDTLDVLTTLVVAYENANMPMLPPDPIEAIKFRLEQQGKSRKDLVEILGTRARVSEVLLGRRALSLAMIRGLHRQLNIPLEVLVSERKKKTIARGARAVSRSERKTA